MLNPETFLLKQPSKLSSYSQQSQATSHAFHVSASWCWVGVTAIKIATFGGPLYSLARGSECDSIKQAQLKWSMNFTNRESCLQKSENLSLI